MKLVCLQCKKEFDRKESRVNKTGNNFCNRKCADKFKKTNGYDYYHIREGKKCGGY